jgi:hypothetical protein
MNRFRLHSTMNVKPRQLYMMIKVDDETSIAGKRAAEHGIDLLSV